MRTELELELELEAARRALTRLSAPVVVAFILVTCSPSPESRSSSLWIPQTALPTRYHARSKCTRKIGL